MARCAMRRLAATYRAAFSDLPREVWLLALVCLVNRAGAMVLPFMSLYMTRELGFTAVVAGQILALYGVGAMGGSLLGGWLADRIGAVRTQELAFLGAAVGFVALAHVRSPAALAVTVLVVSTVAETFRPALMTAVALKSPPAVRVRAMALIRLAVNLGMSVGPAVGGILATHHYGWLFYGDALSCTGALVVLYLTVHRQERLTGVPRGPERSGRSPWTDLPYLGFLLLMVGLICAFFQLFSTWPLYLRSAYGFSEASIGGLLAMNALMIVLFEMVLLRAVEHLDHLHLAALGALLVCGGLAILPLGRSLAFAVVAVLVWSVGEMLCLPLTNAVAATRAAAGGGGATMGAYSLSFSVAFVIAPAAGTSVYQHLGPAVLWGGVGVLGIVIAAGFVALAPAFRA